MNHKQLGDRIPRHDFQSLINGELGKLTYESLFENKRVVLFALPGAYTPTCSASQVPSYVRLQPVFRQHGIDAIYCLSVNDMFVMQAWSRDQGADNLTFLADGNGSFTRGMGFLVDKSDLSFGPRSWRYAMVVNNGIIEALFVEPERPGDPYEVSDAENVLNQIAPDAPIPPDITVITKPGCKHCVRAKALLGNAGLDFEEVVIGSNGVSASSLYALSGASTVPQVFVDGQRIGGADDLSEWLD